MTAKACALTGHRELPEDFPAGMLAYALEDLVDGGYTVFYCGMARGFDLLALECLAAIKQRKKIFIEACIPYAGHEQSFSLYERKRYKELLSVCDKKTVLFPSYRAGCMLARNRYMVDRCDLVFAYCEKKTGGTAYTVQYAEKCGIEIKFFGTEA